MNEGFWGKRIVRLHFSNSGISAQKMRSVISFFTPEDKK